MERPRGRVGMLSHHAHEESDCCVSTDIVEEADGDDGTMKEGPMLKVGLPEELPIEPLEGERENSRPV